MRRSLRRNDVNKRSSNNNSGTIKRNGAVRRAETIAAANTLGSRDRNDPAWDVVRTLINGGTDPSRLLELYYWTREPGIIELIRAYLDLPEATQRNLGNFLLNTKPHSVAAAFDAQGGLLLLSRQSEAASR